MDAVPPTVQERLIGFAVDLLGTGERSRQHGPAVEGALEGNEPVVLS